MKNTLAVLILALLVATSSVAQQRVHPKDLEGTSWEMVFDFDKQGDNAIERIALNAVNGFMDEIDIRFDFLDDNVLRVQVEAFGEVDDDDTEYATWTVNDRGYLELGETDSFEASDTMFMREGDRLVAFEIERGKRERKDGFYLKRIR